MKQVKYLHHLYVGLKLAMMHQEVLRCRTSFLSFVPGLRQFWSTTVDVFLILVYSVVHFAGVDSLLEVG